MIRSVCIGAENVADMTIRFNYRIIYLHSSCVTGTCQVQCKTAVLNLYQLALGRALLHTDLSCLGRLDSPDLLLLFNKSSCSVYPELAKCQLIPTARPLHCSLAKQMCELDAICGKAKTNFIAECEEQLQVR